MECITMNWIAVDNGVFVSIFGQEFIYKNQATNEETHYGFDVLKGVPTAIGTRGKGISEAQILRAIQQWLSSKSLEERVKLDYKQSRQALSQVWNDEAKFLMSMAKSIVVPFRLRGAEITEYLSNKSWEDYVNQWRHNSEYHKRLSKKQEYLNTFLESQNRILSALLWLQKNRKLIANVVNYKSDSDSFYYEVILGLPVIKIRSVVMAQIREKRRLTDTYED